MGWQKVDVPKIGSAELLFQVKPQILSLGRAKWQILSWGKVCVPKIGSAELLFQVKPQILSLGGAKWQILSWGKVCVVKIGFGKGKKLRWGLSTQVLNFVW